MRVIGMLLGIPEEDQEAIRDHADASLRTEAGKPMRHSQDNFVQRRDLRRLHRLAIRAPVRRPDDRAADTPSSRTRPERRAGSRARRVLTYVNVVAGAGNETTTRLIGWAGKVLADHPDQRRELVEDLSLVPNAIEELLRYEPPAPHVGRYVRE